MVKILYGIAREYHPDESQTSLNSYIRGKYSVEAQLTSSQTPPPNSLRDVKINEECSAAISTTDEWEGRGQGRNLPNMNRFLDRRLFFAERISSHCEAISLDFCHFNSQSH
jgi:hypothetical protein